MKHIGVFRKIWFAAMVLAITSTCSLFAASTYTIINDVFSSTGFTQSTSSIYTTWYDLTSPSTTVVGSRASATYTGYDGVFGYFLVIVNSPSIDFAVEGSTLNIAVQNLNVEGSQGETTTESTFDEWILIQNPNNQDAQVRVTFMKEDATTSVIENTVLAGKRWTIHVNSYVPNSSVSAKIESLTGVDILAERAMYWDVNGQAWGAGHDSICISALSTIWYFAEGSTQDFDEWLLVLNPSDTETAEVLITLMKPDGSTIPINRTIGPHKRETVHVNNYAPYDSVSAKIESTNGVGVGAERSMYWASGGKSMAGGHNSIGATATSTTWYFAEGCTKGFDEYIPLMNPNSSGTAKVSITLTNESGYKVPLLIEVPPLSRRTIKVNDYFTDTAISAKIESLPPDANTSAVGIIAERSMYWNAGGDAWKEGHNTIGAPATGVQWYLPEGSTKGTFDEWILIQNTDRTRKAHVTVTFMLDDGSSNVVLPEITIPESSRYSIHVNNVEGLADKSASAIIQSDGPGIIVERAMYWNSGGTNWAGGHCSIGIKKQ